MKYPRVMSEDATLDAALAGKSLSRFGDGELRLAAGGQCSSQRAEPGLAEELREILVKPARGLLPCIPNLVPSPRREWWKDYMEGKFRVLMRLEEYGSSFITRPDNMPSIDRPEYWAKVRQLWAGRSVILVRGDDKSLTPQRMPEARSIHVVHGPRQHAYTELGRIEREVTDLHRRLIEESRDYGDFGDYFAGNFRVPVIMCLGAAATVLAQRLAAKGIWALDLGHVGMFMKHEGAYSATPDQLASPKYRKLLREKHMINKWGGSGHSHLPEIIKYRDELGAKSILDYGCGRGTLRRAVEEVDPVQRVYEYDPGIHDKSSLPKPADLVVCTDVLEHIEPKCLDAVLGHMHRLAGKGMYLVIAQGAAKTKLGDGRNAHLIQQNSLWWIGKLRTAGFKIDRFEERKGLNVWVKK